MAPRVLVVEDEDTLRTSIVRGLSRHLNVPVDGAATLGEALALIDENPPTVILCDLDLPDRAGIEIIGELGRRGIRAAVTFVSAYTRAFLAQIPKHAGVRVLEKPVTIEQLRTLVREDLGRQSSDAPSPFGVADYLQLAAMGGHSVLIEVAHKQGRIIVVRGELWSATDPFGDGDAAFRRLCLEREGVRCTTWRDAPGIQNVHGRWEAMLLDEARSLDERRRDGVASDPQQLLVPRTEVIPELPEVSINPAPPVVDETRERFDMLMEDGLSALLRRRYEDAFDAFSRAAQLDATDRTVQANLLRLKQLGYGNERKP
jgi:CheY-like chemotaxis protein